ncbi:MFS general substrate transporter [Basidiobolus meristosporus CBS 931.73]|uniref:MFS general substrate transporter n=1 Tax=Basidiobolus meristosporus CBS 931.73 TaxID=1314790 RepID=A0A1Y1YPB9_9FUNG|nr:MFS general substrate transporter [Basidiobolus meristosporus CBS 931.73]|eukprot:ORX99859.1 MFS general substrate transporter [Basidiobolus meristosporus CBS 931.73]
MSLVWLAGPLSGLLIQPVIGAISDDTQCRYGRRRPYIVGGGVLVLSSVAAIAYAKELAHLFAVNSTDNDSVKRNVAILIAVVAFYILDFSINAVQACCRALILDRAPHDQQEVANAYAGRMLNIGSVVGYFMGFIDLVEVFPMLGKTQMQILCAIAGMVFVFSLGITCLSVTEVVPHQENTPGPARKISITSTLQEIWYGFRYLPSPVQKICNVQFFAWMGWFPFLFYSTTWITEVYIRNSRSTDPDIVEDAIRAGSFALFIQSIVSLVTTLVLPMLTEYLSEGKEVQPCASEDSACTKIQKWSSNACIHLFDIHNIYTFSLVFFGTVMLVTYWVGSATEASVIVMLCGISWGIALWIPFALVGEFVSSNSHSHSHSTPGSAANTKCLPAVPESSTSTLYSSENNTSVITMSSNMATVNSEPQEPVLDSGIVLGIHNMYVVFPQFVIILVSTFIFTLLKESSTDSVGWVLRVGGVCSFVAAYLSLKLKPSGA